MYSLFAPSSSQSSCLYLFQYPNNYDIYLWGRLVELGHNILCHTLQFCLPVLHLNTRILYNVNSNSEIIWFKKSYICVKSIISIIINEWLKTFPLIWGGCKDIPFYHFYAASYEGLAIAARQRKRHIVWKGKYKTVFILRQHAHVCRKS